MIATQTVWPAMVVTYEQRISGTITAQDADSVTLRGESGKTVKIMRQKILQIFDDQGELTWQGALPPEEKIQKTATPEAHTPSARKSLLLDLYIGGVTGGPYSDEQQFTEDLKISAQYSDGSTQYAKSTLLALGGGISFQNFNSERWSTLISYLYRSTSHSVYVGDGSNHERASISNLVLTRRHGLLYGKELHFYPSSENATLDLIAQIGYELGSYAPLATYNDYREHLLPPQPALAGPKNMLIHGPAARFGAGIAFYGAQWQFRFTGFYQLTALFTPEATAISRSTAALTHDYYAGVSLGYRW